MNPDSLVNVSEQFMRPTPFDHIVAGAVALWIVGLLLVAWGYWKERSS